MLVFIACFDITDDHVRRRVSRRLQHFGLRIQRSVFEISVKNRRELEVLRRELGALLDGGDDLRFYNLCKSCRAESHDHLQQRVAFFPAATVL